MSAQFKEVRPNYGVDDTKLSIPEMIVPMRGTNHILLVDGDGLKVEAETPNMVEITEVKDFMTVARPKPRMFRLKGKMLPGKAGLSVVARRGSAIVARLRVFVLEPRTVKLAVRPLQTAPGKFHARSIPTDLVQFVNEMNEIWVPQAAVVIDMVSDSPALITSDPEENAANMGAFLTDGFTPDTQQGVWKESIGMLSYSNVKSFGPVFLAFLDSDSIKAEFTLFIVQAISTFLGSFTSGATDPSYKFALVRGDASSRVWAHELGHLLRKAHGESIVAGELMVSGGPDADTKIPVKEAVELFNGLHTKVAKSR